MFDAFRFRSAGRLLLTGAGFLLSLLCSPQAGIASTHGFSLNLNFAASDTPIRKTAGLFGERIWNNLPSDEQGIERELFADAFGDNGKSPANIAWETSGIGQNDGLQVPNPDDAEMMSSFFQSPSRIELNGLEFVVPPHDGPLNYTVLIYSFGGQEGKEGVFNVNGISRPHIDSGDFDGTFRAGLKGNLVIFPDLNDPFLTIFTEGHAPMNAMSIMYCRPGDFNSDGMVDVTDLEELNQATKNGSTDWQYDINIDGQVNNDDVLAWIQWSKGTCIGDVNLDGVFDSTDLVQLFQVGIYESGDTATWVTGDWNGDCVFDSSDLLLAFQEGCYEAGEAMASPAKTVPEPAGALLLALGLIGWFLHQRRSVVPSCD